MDVIKLRIIERCLDTVSTAEPLSKDEADSWSSFHHGSQKNEKNDYKVRCFFNSKNDAVSIIIFNFIL